MSGLRSSVELNDEQAAADEKPEQKSNSVRLIGEVVAPRITTLVA